MVLRVGLTVGVFEKRILSMRWNHEPRVSFFVCSCCFAVGMIGCERGTERVAPKDAVSAAGGEVGSVRDAKADGMETDSEHTHVAGAHGGTIVPIGSDSYHAEALVDSDGKIRVFLLGKDETRIQEVEAQTLSSYVKGQGQAQAISVPLVPEAQLGDGAGKTSQFVGQLPKELLGQGLTVTIPSLPISGERFRVAFVLEGVHGGHGMPGGVRIPEDERKLYLTSGGRYTQEDIEANGMTVPSVKYDGIASQHDDNPRVGDRICPISKTKANDAFAWVIDGKSYTFCCPPCMDEYVRLAKERPDELKDPSEFVKQ